MNLIVRSLKNEGNGNQYEEYDLDEQDCHWLVAYNQFRHEKRRRFDVSVYVPRRWLCIDLPELDENIFEYIMQLFEHQCLVAIRQKNYEDQIECDACHRVMICSSSSSMEYPISIQIDDVDDLIQCIQCHTIVHKVSR